MEVDDYGGDDKGMVGMQCYENSGSVVKFGRLLRVLVRGHQSAATWDRAKYITLAFVAVLCAVLSPVCESLIRDGSDRKKSIIIIGAINALVVSVSTLMGYQARMDKHIAACVEYTTMFDRYIAKYDPHLSLDGTFPSSLLREFAKFHAASVDKIEVLSAKTPPLPSRIRSKIEQDLKKEEDRKMKDLIFRNEGEKINLIEDVKKQRGEKACLEEEKNILIEDLRKHKEDKAELDADLDRKNQALREKQTELKDLQDEMEKTKQVSAVFANSLQEQKMQTEQLLRKHGEMDREKSELQAELQTLRKNIEKKKWELRDLANRARKEEEAERESGVDIADSHLARPRRPSYADCAQLLEEAAHGLSGNVRKSSTTTKSSKSCWNASRMD